MCVIVSGIATIVGMFFVVVVVGTLCPYGDLFCRSQVISFFKMSSEVGLKLGSD